MQFIVIGHDYKDGLERRLEVRNQHVEQGDAMREAGNYLFGVAMLDESGKMSGSIMVMEYPSRKKLDDWLKSEPYVTNNVWEKIEIIPGHVGPSFVKK
ncbi:MAG TPA: YciI family protein [Candidatus Saccharimonadales bacterium]|nr:YciI family protein [Candidatus Saccharimonadales bacterium]